MGLRVAGHGAKGTLTGERKIQMTEFYAHRLMQRHLARSGTVEMPHAGGRLFQQYLVDAYTKVEAMRLDWVTRNQQRLRTETLQ